MGSRNRTSVLGEESAIPKEVNRQEVSTRHQATCSMLGIKMNKAFGHSQRSCSGVLCADIYSLHGAECSGHETTVGDT